MSLQNGIFCPSALRKVHLPPTIRIFSRDQSDFHPPLSSVPSIAPITQQLLAVTGLGKTVTYYANAITVPSPTPPLLMLRETMLRVRAEMSEAQRQAGWAGGKKEINDELRERRKNGYGGSSPECSVLRET